MPVDVPAQFEAWAAWTAISVAKQAASAAAAAREDMDHLVIVSEGCCVPRRSTTVPEMLTPLDHRQREASGSSALELGPARGPAASPQYHTSLEHTRWSASRSRH